MTTDEYIHIQSMFNDVKDIEALLNNLSMCRETEITVKFRASKTIANFRMRDSMSLSKSLASYIFKSLESHAEYLKNEIEKIQIVTEESSESTDESKEPGESEGTDETKDETKDPDDSNKETEEDNDSNITGE